jgi:hypothetical protein
MGEKYCPNSAIALIENGGVLKLNILWSLKLYIIYTIMNLLLNFNDLARATNIVNRRW